MPQEGATAFSLLSNCLHARTSHGDLNHITGDIHYIALALNGKRTVLTIHDLRMLQGKATIKKMLLKWLWFTLPVKMVRYVTVISEETQRELLNHVKVDPEKVVVIPNCVSPIFKYTPCEFNINKPLILQIGTTENKNIERLAQALSGIDCRLKILGRPTINQIKVLNECKIDYEWVAGLTAEQVYRLYCECDLVAFVSTFEGFGMPIIEGQAVGRPVVTSRLPPMTDVAGGAACLVDPFNVIDIKRGILKIIDNCSYREMLVSDGLRNALRYSPQAIVQEYTKIYKNIINNKCGK